ncbi:MAG: DUF2723 domain-containing protein [Chloroflexi bacterium]|nr:DUF2723 domain-containing protein [Chloroflexota bacterium]MBU1748852.1 DUF2723 domain-containing protein [Chloroflexota bacterium]
MRTVWRDHAQLVAAGLVALAAFVIYLLTLAPTVGLVDSGELTLAAWTPGIAHPPGFPTYTLLAWPFVHLLPLGNVAWRLNLFSALWAALSALLVFAIVHELVLPDAPAPAPLRSRKRSEAMARPPGPSLVAPTTAALAWAFGLTLWTWATVAEVYTLGVCLTALALWLILRWRRRRAHTQGDLYLAAVVLGLALGNHHATVLLLLPALVYLVGVVAGWRFFATRPALIALVGLLLGLLVYAYLPLRAAADPLFNWGDPSTPERFLRHVTGWQYRVNLFTTPPGRMVELLGELAGLWLAQFAWVGALLAAIGGVRCARLPWGRRWLVWTALIVVPNVLYAVNYDIAEDLDAYLLPTFLATVVLLGLGAAQVQDWIVQRRARWQPVGAIALLLVALLPLVVHWRACDRHAYFVADDYAANVLAPAELGALVLTSDWNLYAPTLYLQHVQSPALRPDVTVIDVQLLRRSWYFDYLARVYPQLMAEVQAETDAFLVALAPFEAGGAYDSNLLQTRFVTLVNRLIDVAVGAGGVVYVTPPGLEPGMGEAYQWVPAGAAFRLYADAAYRAPPAVRLETRGLVDGSSIPIGSAERQVRQVYADMLANRGLYLAQRGQRCDEAVSAYRQALQLDPAHVTARLGLAQCYAVLGDLPAAQAEYEAVLRLDPANAVAQQGLAVIRARLRQ